MWLATIAAFALFCCLGSQWMMQVKPAINGIYSQNGPWYHVKYWSFCLLLALQKLAKSKRDLKCLDQTQTFSAEAEQHGNDSIFFIGSCTKTGLTFIVATERRPNNITYGLVYVMTPKGDLWRGNWLPYSRLIRLVDESFSGGGINVRPLEFMRSWKIDFGGTLRNISTRQEIQAKIDLVWNSDEPVVLFDEALPVQSTAKAFAREPWNRQFFDDLKKAHQTHYEQIGLCRGEIHLLGDKQEVYTLDAVSTFRDHSFGTRDWKLMHRYIFHIILLADGTKMLAMAICQPHTCTQLELGYVSTKSGRITYIDESDLCLAHHGEGGRPQTDYAFSVVAGGHEYFVQVQSRGSAGHFLGEENEAKNIELFAHYNVNGIPGYGIVEWNYRNFDKAGVY